MKFWQRAPKAPIRCTGESGQVIEWNIASWLPYGTLVDERPTEPSSEDAIEDDKPNISEKPVEIRTLEPQQVSRLRRRNIIRALPMYIATVNLLLLPLDLWLPALLRFTAHASTNPTTPISTRIATALLVLLTILTFTTTSCLAFRRSPLLPIHIYLSMSFLSTPVSWLVGFRIIPTSLRWPTVLYVAANAGAANAYIMRTAMDFFRPSAFGSCGATGGSATSAFCGSLLVKAMPNALVLWTWCAGEERGAPLGYMWPISIGKVAVIFVLLYSMQMVGGIVSQMFLPRIFKDGRGGYGAIMAVVDVSNWAVEMRVCGIFDKAVDPGLIEVEAGRRREDVRIVQVSALVGLLAAPLMTAACLYIGWFTDGP